MGTKGSSKCSGRTEKIFLGMADRLETIRQQRHRYDIAHRTLVMYFTVRQDTRENAEPMATYYAWDWAPWGGYAGEESWQLLRKSILEDVQAALGPGIDLRKAYEGIQQNENTFLQAGSWRNGFSGSAGGVRSPRTSDRLDSAQRGWSKAFNHGKANVRQRAKTDAGSYRNGNSRGVQEASLSDSRAQPRSPINNLSSIRRSNGKSRGSLYGEVKIHI
jgi:hypothetical protein